MSLNPNGESDCDASHAASDKSRPTAGLIAKIYTASPMPPWQQLA